MRPDAGAVRVPQRVAQELHDSEILQQDGLVCLWSTIKGKGFNLQKMNVAPVLLYTIGLYWSQQFSAVTIAKNNFITACLRKIWLIAFLRCTSGSPSRPILTLVNGVREWVGWLDWSIKRFPLLHFNSDRVRGLMFDSI